MKVLSQIAGDFDFIEESSSLDQRMLSSPSPVAN